MKRGRMIADGTEHATLVFEREYPHAIEHVWDAIATPDGLRGWLMCTTVAIDGRVGGAIEMVAGPAQYRARGTILRWDPPRALEYEWRIAPVAEMPRGEQAIFCYELDPITDGTRLIVTYRRITMQTARGFLPGTHAFLDRLEAQLAGEPLPDWHARFAALRREYPEWSEHAPAAG
ncbi:MAG TPA: SRPBCC domain-containing protein [Kofleriaceae bacterium]|jgi:uncharacterized protein YndB with AHSA1/START domain|nr:SRPBCC domain-containing protein [Kofleriaceae bacterium]